MLYIRGDDTNDCHMTIVIGCKREAKRRVGMDNAAPLRRCGFALRRVPPNLDLTKGVVVFHRLNKTALSMLLSVYVGDEIMPRSVSTGYER